MDETDISAYREAVQAGRYVPEQIADVVGTSVAEAVRIGERLLALHLLHPMPGEADVLAPVSPDAAAAGLLGPAEQEIRQLQRSVTVTRTNLLALLPMYFESRRRRNRMEAFDVISDAGVVQSMLYECGKRSTREVLTAQPGGARPSDLLDAAGSRTLERLERGLRVQHLYQHTVRSDLATTAYIREVSAAGAEVRTTDQLIDRMAIYDREIVFLPEQNVVGRNSGAIVVREPTLVAFLCKLYDHLWAQGTGYDPLAEDTGAITEDLKRAIIRLMAQGHKDEMVARRLGMSVRTCRRHISEIMEELDSASRFQAGVNVALSGMLDLEQEPPGR
ncbi:LuxR C-terminal-related transcriptional regulator [Streptomyces boninensis]|uniref:helix-turn-helix transcriptional regulator n=1 Tax=Streptomyces boninensis TaxID=2039455 RepID=UPI003B22173B